MVKIDNMIKTYEGKGNHTEVLKNISLEVKQGEFLAIMGKSGCGKTTLLNIIGLIDSFNEGNYLLNGLNVKDFKASEMAKIRRDNIGYVYQAFNLINELNCEDNVSLTLGYAGIRSTERKARAHQLLESVGLKDKFKAYPSQLSGGQKQRVAIARAISNSPALILADEPTGNLDYNSGIEIMELLQKLNANGTTIIMVTHDEEFAGYATKRIDMKDGVFINSFESHQ